MEKIGTVGEGGREERRCGAVTRASGLGPPSERRPGGGGVGVGEGRRGPLGGVGRRSGDAVGSRV